MTTWEEQARTIVIRSCQIDQAISELIKESDSNALLQGQESHE